jgi:phosphoribosyl-ATP pyrophosphohydrolase/phosphoribosyl-AMP cyclohydrolase
MNHVAEEIRFGPDGLLPAIVQDASDGSVLMLAYMNQEALTLTLHTGYTHFWSRSRQTLWQKGEESGNVQRVVDVRYDCDGDTLLVQVVQQNVACHTGQRSCFFRTLPLAPGVNAASEADVPRPPAVTEMLAALYHLILLRRDTGDASSYVYRLFQRGHDGICKKVVEEAAEVLLASKNETSTEIVYEMADLWFHALVLLGYHSVHPHEVLRELQRRFGQPGGGKVVQSPAPVFPPSHDTEA